MITLMPIRISYVNKTNWIVSVGEISTSRYEGQLLEFGLATNEWNEFELVFDAFYIQQI